MDNNNFNIIQTQENEQIVIAFDNVFFDLETLLKNANILVRETLLGSLAERLHNYGYGRLGVVQNKNSNNTQHWNENGIEAKILDPEVKGWKKGKVRLRMVLEFCPDEESENSSLKNPDLDNHSLNHIRQNMTETQISNG